MDVRRLCLSARCGYAAVANEPVAIRGAWCFIRLQPISGDLALAKPWATWQAWWASI